MKQLNKILVTLVVAVLIALPVANVGFAQNEDSTIDDSTVVETTVTSENEPEEEPDRKAEIEARKLERQERFSEINEARAERVASRCTGAQQKLSNAITRSKTVETNRMEKYGNISSKLETFISRASATDIDTTTLSEQVTAYDSLVEEFYTLLDSYQLALADAAELDCETDTEGFLLAIEDARSLLDQLKDKSKEISTQVRDTIVATLMEIKDSLSNGDGSGEDEAEDEAEEEGDE